MLGLVKNCGDLFVLCSTRRLLQLLSAGLFLADNDGVADPCEVRLDWNPFYSHTFFFFGFCIGYAVHGCCKCVTIVILFVMLRCSLPTDLRCSSPTLDLVQPVLGLVSLFWSTRFSFMRTAFVLLQHCTLVLVALSPSLLVQFLLSYPAPFAHTCCSCASPFPPFPRGFSQLLLRIRARDINFPTSRCYDGLYSNIAA